MTQRFANIILSFVMLSICAVFLYLTNKLSYPSNVFPYIIIAGIVILTLIILLQNIFSKNEAKFDAINYKRVFSIILISIIYISAISTFGFYSVTFIYLLVMCFSLQSHETGMSIMVKLRNSLLLTIFVVILVYFVFNILLKVPTPRGFLI